MSFSIGGLLFFFILYSAAQFALETFKKDAWPSGTGTFPTPKFFYGPALATAVLFVLMILL